MDSLLYQILNESAMSNNKFNEKGTLIYLQNFRKSIALNSLKIKGKFPVEILPDNELVQQFGYEKMNGVKRNKSLIHDSISRLGGVNDIEEDEKIEDKNKEIQFGGTEISMINNINSNDNLLKIIEEKNNIIEEQTRLIKQQGVIIAQHNENFKILRNKIDKNKTFDVNDKNQTIHIDEKLKDEEKNIQWKSPLNKNKHMFEEDEEVEIDLDDNTYDKNDSLFTNIPNESINYDEYNEVMKKYKSGFLSKKRNNVDYESFKKTEVYKNATQVIVKKKTK